MLAVDFGSSVIFLVVVVAVVTYILNVMYQIVEVCHFMQQ